MAIARSFDATAINAAINHPDVFPWVSVPGMDSIDMTPLVADRRNVLLMGETGGIFFHWQEPGIYIAHTNFLPGESRGRQALADTRDAIFWMFTAHDGMELLTFVPKPNRVAAMWARAVGAELDFERDAAWPTADGLVPVRYYALRFDRWVRQEKRLPARGEWFHVKLEVEKRRFGVTDPLHPHDPEHDRRVGTAVEMIFAGQVDKAIILYNRWARFAGYAQVRLISREPLIIDQQDALILVNGQDFEVLRCRPQAQ